MLRFQRFWRVPSLLLLTAGLVGGAANQDFLVQILFDYPTNSMSTNLTFVLHGTSTVGLAPTNWPVDKTIPAMNYYAGGSSTGSVTAPIEGTNYVLSFDHTVLKDTTPRYWYLTASNQWGESVPSNVIVADGPPAPPGNARGRGRGN